MPTFFARRYARDLAAVGRVEKTLGVAILLLVAGIIAVMAHHAATNRDVLFAVRETMADKPDAKPLATDKPFPPPGVEDWRAPQRVERFRPDELYMKIDGRADAYLALHVAGLTFGTYAHATEGDRTVDVYWYEMGTPDDARRAYETEEPRDAPPVALGDGGYQVGGAVFFHQGVNYVQVLPARLEDAHEAVELEIARRMAARLTP